MRKMFEFDSKGNINPDPEVLALLPFKKIWSRDKNRLKSKALSEISYIWFMCSEDKKKNPYYEAFIGKEEERSSAIIADVLDANWKPDKVVQEAIKVFNKREYSDAKDTLHVLKTTRQKIKGWLGTFDPSVEESLDLKRNIESLNAIARSIKDQEELVNQEEAEKSSIRGGSEVGYFEN